MDGVLNINKSAGMTSHDVVDRLRRLLHEKKVGHTGTLDPDATGVLPVCLGKATKIIRFIQDGEKEYEGTITLGIVTDTLDASGKILDISDNACVEIDDVRRVFSDFLGEMDQIPPMVSAIKVQGKRLYKIARQGKTINRTPRRICIYDLELLDVYNAQCLQEFDPGSGRSLEPRGSERDVVPSVDTSRWFTRIDFRVRCSRGTYIRSLAADIGDALGSGAHLTSLVRTRSGPFELRDSVRLEEIQTDPQSALRKMRSVDEVLSSMPVIVITDLGRRRFLNGVPVIRSEVVRYGNEFRVGDMIRVHDEAGMLLGIGEATVTCNPLAGPNAEDPGATICKAVRVLGQV